MSDGQHGIQPARHSHVHCPHCNAHGVHIDQVEYARTGRIKYGAHARKGSTVPCENSRGFDVPVEEYLRGLRVHATA